MSDLNDLNRPVTTDTEPNVLDTLRAHIIRAATWSGWSGTAGKVAGLISGVTAAVSGGRSMRLYRRNDANTTDEEVVSLPGVSIGGKAATSGKAEELTSFGIQEEDAYGTTRGPTGMRMFAAYDNGYPTAYGNVLHMSANGSSQVLLGWSGSDGVPASNFIRSKRDNDSGAWSPWAEIVTSYNVSSLVVNVLPSQLSTGAPKWNAAGNLGVDVLPTGWGSAFSVFQVGPNSSLWGLKSGGSTYQTTNAYFDGIGYKYRSNGPALEYVQVADGSHRWYTAAPGLAGADLIFKERMRLDASGNFTVSAWSGMVAYFAGSAPPVGWLKANGAAVSRTTYADLFTAIGETYGEGDGSTTFQLPDLRGVFQRGWDDGRGVDAGRSLGSAQLDAMQGHRHATQAGSSAGQNFGYSTSATGTISLPAGNILDPVNDGVNGIPRTAAETRPRNVALLACIKY